MFTKLVVTVARTTSSAAHQPTPAAASMVPGSSLPAIRARFQPTGISQSAGNARPANTAVAPARAESRVARVVSKHQQPRHLVANDDVDAPQQGRWRLPARNVDPWRQREGRPRQHRAGDHHDRHRNAIRVANGARSARDDSVASTPRRPPTDARRFAAKHLRAHRRGNRVVDRDPREVREIEQARHRPAAPRSPSGARAAIIDGTPNRDPTGASIATSRRQSRRPTRPARPHRCGHSAPQAPRRSGASWPRRWRPRKSGTGRRPVESAATPELVRGPQRPLRATAVLCPHEIGVRLSVRDRAWCCGDRPTGINRLAARPGL